jgi:ureidoglycolate lyase
VSPRLLVEPLTREAFRPFGDVIGTEGARHFPINDGTAERYHDLARLDLSAGGGRPILSLFRAQPRRFPLRLTIIERHPLGSQAFMPLASRPYLVVVAPPGEAPPASDLRAFAVTQGEGVNYAPGVWHHPLLALEKESDFLVIDREGPGDNCEILTLDPAPLLVWGEADT